MKIKKLISGVIASLFLTNLAIADSSTNFKVDISAINATGTVSSSTNYKINSATIGFVDGNMGTSSGFTLGSGLPYLELYCGNGILEFGEQCDDGNKVSGDGCSNICKTEAGPICGNGILQGAEQCDDGNVVSGDGCSNVCTTEVGAVCGNGILQAGEQCDDGNLTNGDGCSASCTTETGGGGGGGGYTTPYSYHACGNGKIEYTEQCDDKNTNSGDGCSDVCKIEDVRPVAPEEPTKPPFDIEKPEEQPTDIVPEEGVSREIKIKARPEKRVHPEDNWSLPGRLVFYNKTLKKVVLTIDIGMNDIGWGRLDSKKLPDGIYDISFKGISHLTKVIRNINIDSSTTTLDFTDGERFFLIAGDVFKSKDDFINGLDISAAIDLLYSSDIHGDLNRDGIVNGLDISIVVSNIYKHGEKINM